MGSCCGKIDQLNPGAVLDRVISQASNDDDCLLYKLANYKKTGELIDAYGIGGALEVEKLVREQFGILMYKDGKGQIISRTEYFRWKFRNQKQVVIPVEAKSVTDPLGKWDDHEACWQMQYRGSLGETLLHVLIICDTRLHTKLARILLKCFPKLGLDVFEGEEYLGASGLHLAIAYSNNELVRLLVESGANVQQRAIGSFFLPRDQQREKPAKLTDYEGLAYLGEYPLAWAACMGNESVYNLLLDEDANPDAQDSFGNMVLHMVVVTDQLGMYGYALRHPKLVASNEICNYQGLTPLTLACRLGRASVFREMLELSCREFWRYSNITCSAYPLNALDTILPDGRTNWNSALFIILAGSKEEHLNMLDGGIIQRLLEEKWKTFAQRQFMKRITIAFVHLLFMSIAVYLRPNNRAQSLMEYHELADLVRLGFEVATIIGCLSFVVVQQGGEIKNQGFLSFVKQLPHAPPKAMFLVANFLILSCIPCRLLGHVLLEETFLCVAMVGSWFFMIFFAGAIKLTGPFVTMVYSMITGDMLTFGIIYLIFILAFSQAFFYLYKSHPNVNNLLFEDFHMTWMALYQMTLGQYSYDDLSQIAYPNMAKAVFIMFMILVPILLLNMLIAMMGNTYSQVIERSEKEWVKQWAKIVVTLERAVSQDEAKQHIQEYSIKLGGSDPSVELRGVMVIKTKSKTRAKQRKGAVTNWKRVGKVTITALKRRGMTGEEMRILMWGHRSSICTPQTITPRQQSVELDLIQSGRRDGSTGLANLNLDLCDPNALKSGAETNSPNFFGCFDDSATAAIGKITSATISDDVFFPNTASPNQNLTAAASTASEIVPTTTTTTETKDKLKLNKRRNITMGLRPKIIIFSDKKDLIRVSLDSDDSDNDGGDFSGVLTKYPTKYHRFKSSRRKSIAGDSINFTSSDESLRGDTDEDELMLQPQHKRQQSLSPRVEITAPPRGADRGFDNFAYITDETGIGNEGHTPAAGRGAGKPTGSKTHAKISETRTPSEAQEGAAGKSPTPSATGTEQVEKPKKGRPKSANPRKHEHKSSKVTLEEILEKGEQTDGSGESKTKKSSKKERERSKSAKGEKKKASAVAGAAGPSTGENQMRIESRSSGRSNGSQLEEKKPRPQTAFSRNTEVTNMSKLVAWDRPEDYV